MKSVSLFFIAILLSASAMADGFTYTPVAPSPERHATLEALCARLEVRGFPRIPPDAEWTRADYKSYSDLDNELYFREEDSCPSGMAWLVDPNGQNGTNTLVGVSGYRFQCLSNDCSRGRIALDVSMLLRRLREINTARRTTGKPRPSSGLAVLFAAGLFRSGREAEADVIVRAIEDERGIVAAERDARMTLARPVFLAARELWSRTGDTRDFTAYAAFIETNLFASPPKVGTTQQSGAAGSDKSSPKGDHLEAAVDVIRAYLDGTVGDIPGLDADEKRLAVELAEWREDSSAEDYAFPRIYMMSIPWLVPAAWTNALLLPDDAAFRVARLGRRVIPFLEALSDDSYPARWESRWPFASGFFVTRGDVARELLSRFLPFDIDSRLLDPVRGQPIHDLTAQFVNASEDDLLRLYVRGGQYSEKASPLLWAHLARRLSYSPFTALEEDILQALRERTILDVDDHNHKKAMVLAGDTALQLADLYLSVRGGAAVDFRDRLCSQLRELSSSFSLPKAQNAPLFYGGCERYYYCAQDPQGFAEAIRAWAGKIATNYATLQLRDGSQDSVHERAEAVAGYYLRRWWERMAPTGDNIPMPPFSISFGIEVAQKRQSSAFARPKSGVSAFGRTTKASTFTLEEIEEMEEEYRE